jgi:hypothetical protein
MAAEQQFFGADASLVTSDSNAARPKLLGAGQGLGVTMCDR